MERARHWGNFVRIDMEDYRYNEATLDLYRTLHAVYPNHVGLVVQACLFKTQEDIQRLAEEGADLRIVKGAYREAASVAWRERSDIDRSFLAILKKQLVTGNGTAIATHDERIIEVIKDFIRTQHISAEQFEFQMLYGIRSGLAGRLVDEGYRVRVYVPFGDDWFAYFMRRLAERPANLAFLWRRERADNR